VSKPSESLHPARRAGGRNHSIPHLRSCVKRHRRLEVLQAQISRSLATTTFPPLLYSTFPSLEACYWWTGTRQSANRKKARPTCRLPTRQRREWEGSIRPSHSPRCLYYIFEQAISGPRPRKGSHFPAIFSFSRPCPCPCSCSCACPRPRLPSMEHVRLRPSGVLCGLQTGLGVPYFFFFFFGSLSGSPPRLRCK
jgi:hypothetical protein